MWDLRLQYWVESKIRLCFWVPIFTGPRRFFCGPPSKFIHLRIRFSSLSLILPHLEARVEVTTLGPEELPVLFPEYLSFAQSYPLSWSQLQIRQLIPVLSSPSPPWYLLTVHAHPQQ